jgi:heterodisulfide reductase subunit C
VTRPEPIDLTRRIAEVTGLDVARCYQCGKCTAGCPMADYMDLTASQVMRLAQFGDDDAVGRLLDCDSVWACAGCLTCAQRCPQQLDPAAVMDVIRESARLHGRLSARARKIVAFHEAFLKTVEKTGRMSEFPLVRRYKLASKDLFSDVLIAPQMVLRGKLSPFSEKIKGRDEIKRMFQRSRAEAPSK